VSDIVQACSLAIANPAADFQVLNVGTGKPTSVLRVAQLLARELGWTGGFEISRKFRAGDIRHCFADISRVRDLLGFAPRVHFEDGIGELVSWVREQRGVDHSSGDANAQLDAFGLVR
jgi:dTDP-L-rhamnose 4-epimerase